MSAVMPRVVVPVSAVADGREPVGVHVDVRGAGGGQVLGPRREPDAVDAGRRPGPAELDQASPVCLGARVDEDDHGHPDALPPGRLRARRPPGAGELFELPEQGG